MLQELKTKVVLLLNCEMVPKHQLKQKVQDGPIKGHLKAMKSHALHHKYHLNPPIDTHTSIGSYISAGMGTQQSHCAH